MAVTAALLSTIGVAIAADSRSTPTTAAIFVANDSYVTVFPLGSNGDVAPISTIDGAATGLAGSRAIALDSKGNIYVGNDFAADARVAGSSVVVFSAGSKGNATPIATIAGPHTGLHTIHSIAVDSSGSIYVGTYITNNGPAGVEVFAAGSDGDVKPRAIIAGRSTKLQNTFGVAVDMKGMLFVANASEGDGVVVFPALSNGNAIPSAVISETDAGNGPVGVALDRRGNIYIANAARRDVPAGIRVYAAGSNGDALTIATIGGSNTGLDGRNIRAIALDSKENLYVTSDGRDGMIGSVTVFAPRSNGNVKPIAVISGDNTGLSGGAGIAIGPYRGAR
jgi:hypothetical protein